MSVAPEVSVIIPCYNHGEFLDEAVRSVLAQTFDGFEIIVVNDGSTDPATQRVLMDARWPRTTVIHTPNAGVSSARNTGIRSARGRYILPLDADDRIAPKYLEQAVKILQERPEVGVVYCDAAMFGESEGLLDLPEYDPVAELFDNLIHQGAFFRKEDWEKVGGFSDSFRYGWEDWDFWISMSMLNKEVTKMPELLYYCRVRSVSRDRSMRLHHKIAMMVLIILRHKRLYLQNSGLFFWKALELAGKVLVSALKRLNRTRC